jgi:hypothetical protein
MTTPNPITPPPELVRQWVAEIWHEGTPVRVSLSDEHIAARAAQWGADQELEACCEWLEDTDCDDPQDVANHLRAARRPKPPSLKERSLQLLETYNTSGVMLTAVQADTIRRALEALPDNTCPPS